MANYASGTPLGREGTPLYGSPAPYAGLARYYTANAGTSSVITVTPNTTAVEIAAGTSATVMRWVSTTDTQASVVAVGGSANFDHVIPAGQVRRFVIPKEGAGGAWGQGSFVGANVQEGLYQRVAIKSEGVGSVFLSEYGSSNSY